MIFRTVLPTPKANFEIDYHNNLLAIGSCFTENIIGHMQQMGFPVHINPFGIVYNPVSIAQSIHFLLTKNLYTEADIFQHNGLWHSWLHHGRFSSADKAKILRGINEQIWETRKALSDVKFLVITLGTSKVYINKKTGDVVANCHKMPSSYFEEKRLSVHEIVDGLGKVFEEIEQQNIDCQIIITVSPIRHIRDGIVENQRSKATLILASDILSQTFSNVHYFPAYEIMMDDLRDYRFYEADMIHPNSQAIDYIWQAFSNAFLNEKTKSIMKEVEKYKTMAQHRPLHTDTEGYQLFVDKVQNSKIELLKKYPFLKI